MVQLPQMHSAVTQVSLNSLYRCEIVCILQLPSVPFCRKPNPGRPNTTDVLPDLRRHILSFLVASPDTPDSSGNTALLSACEHRGTAAVLGLLATHGADFTRRNKGGETALHVACRRGNAEMAKCLVGREILFLPAGSAARGVESALNTLVDEKDARGRRPGEVRDIDVSHDEALAVREVIERESVCAEEG